MFTQEEVVNVTSIGPCLQGYTKKNALAVFAPSVTAYLQHVVKEFPEPLQGKASSDKGRGSFHTIESFEEATDIFLNRPNEVVTFEELDVRLRVPITTQNEINYGITGDYVDVDRFLIGEPEHFGFMEKTNPRGLFATLYIGLTVPGIVDKDILALRSQKILALVDWLEMQEIRTSIRVINNDMCGYTEVIVKDYSDIVDLNMLAVATHGDFYRRHVFRQLEWSPTWRWGYGSCSQHIKAEPFGITVAAQFQSTRAQVEDYWGRAQRTITDALENGITQVEVKQELGW